MADPMTEEVCARCGWVLGTAVTACPACGEPIAARRSGFETNYYPVAAGRAGAGAVGAEGPTASGAAGARASGTSLLREEELGSSASGLGLKAQPVLTCRGGPTSGRRLNLSGPTTTVGRVGATVSVEDPTLSGLHFSIEERGHEFFLRDLGSTNGTFLNGHLVRSAPLESGDEIRAGESVFVFSVLDVIPCD